MVLNHQAAGQTQNIVDQEQNRMLQARTRGK